MTPKHTPGPWSENNWPQVRAELSVGARGTPKIAIIPLRDVSVNEQKANARLIAAAPDMLEVLKALAAADSHAARLADYRSDYDFVEIRKAAALARAAIAKAEGRDT